MDMDKTSIIDLETIISWIPNKHACLLWAGPDVRFPLDVINLAKDIGMLNDDAYSLKKAGSVVAFGQLIAKEHDWGHLARIIVDPAKRGKGYGKLFCTGLIRAAIRTGFKKVSLNVYRNNKGALRLYQKLGFREVAADNASEEIYHMFKTLSG